MPAVAERKLNQPAEGVSREPFTPEEAWGLFDETALLYLGMPGKRFLELLDNGELGDVDSDPRVMRVASLIPLVRKTSARQKTR
jgi:hypothetical protein